MNALERGLVRATQAGLPLVPRPYAQVAATLGVSEDVVLKSLADMLADGRIRRIGAVPNHYALGYRANAMTVWDLPDEHVDTLGAEAGKLPFVTHCYRRPRRLPEWRYNLFAMVHGRSREETARQIAAIGTLLAPHVRASDALYSTRILKKSGLRLA